MNDSKSTTEFIDPVRKSVLRCVICIIQDAEGEIKGLECRFQKVPTGDGSYKLMAEQGTRMRDDTWESVFVENCPESIAKAITEDSEVFQSVTDRLLSSGWRIDSLVRSVIYKDGVPA